MNCAPARDPIRRRAVVVAITADHAELRWTEASCRGCVGCGGRCSLFGGSDSSLRLPSGDVTAGPGDAVDVEVDGRSLRRGATRAYGIALFALLAGVGLGHGAGRLFETLLTPGGSWANVGALLGLVAGTFLAGRLTKRLDAVPSLNVRPCPESDPRDLKELPK